MMGKVLWKIIFSKNSTSPVGILLKNYQINDPEIPYLHEIDYCMHCLNRGVFSSPLKNICKKNFVLS